MSELRCDGCRAKLTPTDENIKFITCKWCRETNKNPNFKETPSTKVTEEDTTPLKNSTFNYPNNEMPAPGHTPTDRPVNKWVAFVICFFLGYFGAHKFYEGKITIGFLYFFTLGLFGIGWVIDLIIILCKPNPYYVN